MEELLYRPNNDKSGYKFWMAYPACESFALSSLGYMWLSRIADLMDGINAERVFTDSKAINIFPNEVQSIAFSLSFDFDFMGVFEVLEKYNIPFLSEDRDDNSPIIFAGGPVITTNPEPYKKIFDFMIIGDGEIVFEETLKILKKNLDKKTTLEKLATLDAVTSTATHFVLRKYKDKGVIFQTPEKDERDSCMS